LKKVIEFAAKLNTQEFDTQVTRLQERLKRSQGDVASRVLSSEVQQRMSRAGLSTGVSPMQAEAQQKASLREMDRFIKEQYRQAAQLNKAIDDRAKSIERLRKMEKEALDDDKKRLEIANKIKEVEGQKHVLERQHMQTMSTVNQSLGQRSGLAAGIQSPEGFARISRAFQMGGVGGAMRAGTRMMGGVGGLALGGVGLLGAGISLADPLIRALASENRNYTFAQGSVAGGLGHSGDVFGNNLASTMFFGGERQRALQTALEKMGKTQFADKYTLGVGGLLGKVAAGAGTGAAIGGAAGMVGGPLAALTAGGGALVGGGIGLAKGAYDIASDQRSRLAFMSNLGSADAKKKLEAMQYSEMMGDFNSLVEAEKQKDPVKRMAEERYQQTRDRNLQAQRAMGLSNDQFYGSRYMPGQGLLGRGFAAGFTDDETLGMSGAIAGAGGSTRSSRYNNVLGNQLMRRMDMTNAGSLIGGLSRQLGGAAETEQATIKVMSEAMKLGLDKSDFASEQRKFAELTVQAIDKSGASSVAGMGQVASGFAAFGAGSTMADIQGMAGAKSFFDSATSQTGNPRGAIFASKIMSDPDLKGLSFDTQKVLSETPEGRITSDHPAVQQAALESGLSPDEVVKKLKGIKGDSVIIRSGVEKQRKSLQAKYSELKRSGMSEADINEELKKSPEFNKMLVGLGTEDSAFVGLSNQEQRSMGMKLVKGDVGAADLEKQVRDRAAGGATGRVEDASIEAVAAQQKVVNDQFLQMKDAMGQAAESAKQMTEQALNMHMRLAEAISKGQTLTPEQFREIMLPEKPNVGKNKQ
jgi:hypothetical protein